MSEPSLALQGAISTLLKANAGVAAIVGTRVYDAVPTNPVATFPYLTIGDDQVLPDIAQDYDGADVVMTIHGWSRGAGFPEVKGLGKAVNAALTDAALTITGFRIVEIIPEQIQYLRDPDGLTRHGVFVFRARTEPST